MRQPHAQQLARGTLTARLDFTKVKRAVRLKFHESSAGNRLASLDVQFNL